MNRPTEETVRIWMDRNTEWLNRLYGTLGYGHRNTDAIEQATELRNAHDRLLAVEKAARELVAAIELDWAQGLRILASTSEAIGNLMDALDIDREEASNALPDA